MPDLNKIIRADSIKYLNSQPEGWIDLVFADPPFNIGYRYHGYEDRKDVDEYVDWSEKWMRAVYRALKPTGSFYLAIGDEFAADLCHVARRKIGFHMRNWIIWHYTFGQQTKKKFALSHTHILYFTKEKPDPGMTNLIFNPDAVRVAWNVSRLCGTFGEREGWHGCQMPFGVLNRIIRASSNPGDVVVDPFNGSGTTVVSAALLGRHYLGIDQSQKYVNFANKRLKHYLRVREGLLQTLNEAQVTPEIVIKTAADVSRASRVETEMDSLGRPRVPRRSYRRRRAVEAVAAAPDPAGR
jgi:DNA modification methylase